MGGGIGGGHLKSIEWPRYGSGRCPGGQAEMREDLGDHRRMFDGGADLPRCRRGGDTVPYRYRDRLSSRFSSGGSAPREVARNRGPRMIAGPVDPERSIGLTLATAGQYLIETSRRSGPPMSSCRSSARTAVTEDNDNGQNRNARIVSALSAGTYFVRIRHYETTGRLVEDPRQEIVADHPLVVPDDHTARLGKQV